MLCNTSFELDDEERDDCVDLVEVTRDANVGLIVLPPPVIVDDSPVDDTICLPVDDDSIFDALRPAKNACSSLGVKALHETRFLALFVQIQVVDRVFKLYSTSPGQVNGQIFELSVP